MGGKGKKTYAVVFLRIRSSWWACNWAAASDYGVAEVVFESRSRSAVPRSTGSLHSDAVVLGGAAELGFLGTRDTARDNVRGLAGCLVNHHGL